MSSFVISTDTTSGQTLVAGEFGFVGPSGSILAPVGSAVALGGTATLISYGAMASSTASGLKLNSVTNTSVTIASTASVVTGGIDLAAVSGDFTGNFAFRNAGAICGGQGISLTAAAFSQINIANDGALQGLGFSAGSALYLQMNNTARAVITNTGMMSTAGTGPTVYALGGGAVTLTNTGNILNASPSQAAISVVGGLTLRNSGFIEGNVTATQSANIFNSGTIDGNLTLNSYNDAVRISGIVMGDVLLGNGTNEFWLIGGRVMGQVVGGAGADTYHIDRSDVTIVDTKGGLDRVFSSVDYQLSPGVEELYLIGGPRGLVATGNMMSNVIVGDAGNDFIRGLAGNDFLDGGEGNNRLLGGFGNDTFSAGSGDDFIVCGNGNDFVHVGFGNDTIFGGFGEDVLSFDQITDPGGVIASLMNGKISFTDSGTMLIASIEDIIGTAFGDNLTGSVVDNVLVGGGGADSLYGMAGNDTLVGGAQGDWMNGGLGSDTFVFGMVSDSAAAGGFDTIDGFQVGYDVIDLSAIDAVKGGADNAFTFIGTQAFTGSGPEVRFDKIAGSGITMIEVRLGGSVVDDMQIVLNGQINLNAASFDL
ncbi:MAG: calcium-binding protein [Cypionkella sp.]